MYVLISKTMGEFITNLLIIASIPTIVTLGRRLCWMQSPILLSDAFLLHQGLL